jgi:hypothetical protein
MYGFQICELMKRNESLRSITVVLAGSIYHKDRYRREPNELYGADAYLEDQDLPDALIPILEKIGAAMGMVASPPQPTLAEWRSAATAAPPPPAATSGAHVDAPQMVPPAPVRSKVATPPVSTSPVAPAAERSADTATPAGQADDGLSEQRAKAERLARIIVSDIILYNEEKFAEAIKQGRVVEMMSPDLEEGRSLFRDRINEKVREEQDYLVEELLRVARLRGMT